MISETREHPFLEAIPQSLGIPAAVAVTDANKNDGFLQTAVWAFFAGGSTAILSSSVPMFSQFLEYSDKLYPKKVIAGLVGGLADLTMSGALMYGIAHGYTPDFLHNVNGVYQYLGIRALMSYPINAAVNVGINVNNRLKTSRTATFARR